LETVLPQVAQAERLHSQRLLALVAQQAVKAQKLKIPVLLVVLQAVHMMVAVTVATL
jgi:hypothetical protein